MSDNQICKVITDRIDGDEFGNEWKVGYTLYEIIDEIGLKSYEIYEDDGRGNGNFICSGGNKRDMMMVISKLGCVVK